METEVQTANAIAYWIDKHFKIYRSEFFSIGGGVTLNKTNGIITLSLFAWLFEIVLWQPTIEIDFDEDMEDYDLTDRSLTKEDKEDILKAFKIVSDNIDNLKKENNEAHHN